MSSKANGVPPVSNLQRLPSSITEMSLLLSSFVWLWYSSRTQGYRQLSTGMVTRIAMHFAILASEEGKPEISVVELSQWMDQPLCMVNACSLPATQYSINGLLVGRVPTYFRTLKRPPQVCRALTTMAIG